MADTPRPRPIEYYNPRPLILGMCFFWGIVMGFCLFYFSPPQQLMPPPPPPPETPTETQTMSPEERRKQGLPTVQPVDVETAPQKPGFETMDFPLPQMTLTTEGGLTGKTALPLTPAAARPAVPTPEAMQANPLSPPIPELMP